jgi:hypothetical protein
MKKLSLSLFLLVLVFFISSAAWANLIKNGDFETGDFTGWMTSGDIEIYDTDDFLGFIGEAQGMDNYFALLGKNTTDGKSQLRQDFDVTGFTSFEISFNWAFDYWDNSRYAQDSFLSLVRQDGAPAKTITMLDLQTQGNGFWSPDGGLAHGTFSEIIDLSDYTTSDARLIFRLIEESDSSWWTGTASMAGIDNIVVTGVAPVPEPGTVFLLGSGLLGLVVYGRKRKLFRK